MAHGPDEWHEMEKPGDGSPGFSKPRLCGTANLLADSCYPPFCCSLAQVSFSDTVRLNTSRSAVESLSTQK